MRTIALALVSTLVACASSTTPNPKPVTNEAAALGQYTSDANGFDTHTFWYDTGREVVVFDAQFTEAYANKAIEAIHASTKSPITWLVVTHPNPDKFNGASAFRAIGAKVVASKATADAIASVHAYKKYYFVNIAKMFTEETYPKLATVDVTFEGTYSLAGGAVELQELAHAGVSTTQTIAKISANKALVVGDLVHHKAHAWLEGGIRDGKPSPDIDSWIAALDELRTFKGWTVYGGRGPSAPVDTAIDEQQNYLRTMRTDVTAYVSKIDKSELSSDKAGAHWKAITANAQKAFPDYALPYMIEYGVYGLAMSVK